MRILDEKDLETILNLIEKDCLRDVDKQIDETYFKGYLLGKLDTVKVIRKFLKLNKKEQKKETL